MIGPQEHVELVGAAEAEARFSGIAERAAAPVLAFAAVMRELETEERTIFDSYGGKYVLTGALEASLTEPSAEGAIRELDPEGLAFGSGLSYAGFQGTTGVGNHRPPSAILKLTDAERVMAPRTVMEYIVHGGRP